MSDEPDDKPSLDAVKAELENTAYNSIAKIMKYLASYYGGYFPDDYELNKEFLKVLTTMVGEMFAHFPDDQVEAVMDAAYQNIIYSQDMAESELTAVNARKAEPEEVQEIKQYDLAKMKPLGNC